MVQKDRVNKCEIRSNPLQRVLGGHFWGCTLRIDTGAAAWHYCKADAFSAQGQGGETWEMRWIKKNSQRRIISFWLCLSLQPTLRGSTTPYWRKSLLVSTQVFLLWEAQINIQTSINSEARSPKKKRQDELPEAPK